MKFSAKQLLKEARGPGTGPEGFVGDISDIEANPSYRGYNGINNVKTMGSFGTIQQNRANYKPVKTENDVQLDQIYSLIFTYLDGIHTDPRHMLYGLKVRLNHIGLDFEFNNKVPLYVGPLSFKLLKYGEKFGTTPTTNLMKDGFDRGQDYTNINLQMTLNQDPSHRYYFSNISLQPETSAPQEAPSITITQGNGMQLRAESFYQFVQEDDKFASNVFNPIVENLMEKVQNKTLTESDLVSRLKFILERAENHLEIQLSEDQKAIFMEGLYKMIFEADDVTLYNAMAKAGGKDPLAERRKRRKAALARLKGEVQKNKNQQENKK